MDKVGNVALLFALIVTGEAVVETIKWLFIVPAEDDQYKLFGRIHLWKLVTLGVSILLTLATSADLFAVLGFPLAIPVLGYVLTGIILARGANVLNDLLKRAKPSDESQKTY